jgi:hypothetical protein
VKNSRSLHLSALISATELARRGVVEHPLYTSIRTIEDIRHFQSQHVFAVWDFMSLLKRLQRDLSCVELPWRVTGAPLVRRFINELVLEEESGADSGGTYASHFELYRASMQKSGADTSAIDLFLERLQEEHSVPDALSGLPIHDNTREFVNTTWSFVVDAPVHCAAAAFTFGREEVIPDMFLRLLDDLADEFPGMLEQFRDYLELHISLDGENHGPMALQMVEELCRDDAMKWKEAEEAAILALTARRRLWDGAMLGAATTLQPSSLL